MGGALTSFSQQFGSWEMLGSPPLLQELKGVEGAHFYTETIHKGTRPYILNIQPFKDTYLNVFFCSPPVLFEPSPSPCAFKCFLKINASHSIFNNRS